MKIVTWNIGGGFIYSDHKQEFDTEKLEYFIKELKSIKPDIVCLQEAHVSVNNNQPKIIADALEFKYIKTKSIADSHLKDGEKLSISTISKYPILSSKFYKLPNPNLQFDWKGKKASSHDKGFLEVKINYGGAKIRVLSGHMVPFHKFKRNFLDDEFTEIRRQIESVICHEKIPAIICADMNFEDIYKLIPNVFNHEFYSILKDKPTTPEGGRYDKIIVSKEWESTKSDIFKGKADHYLCFADVELR